MDPALKQDIAQWTTSEEEDAPSSTDSSIIRESISVFTEFNSYSSRNLVNKLLIYRDMNQTFDEFSFFNNSRVAPTNKKFLEVNASCGISKRAFHSLQLAKPDKQKIAKFLQLGKLFSEMNKKITVTGARLNALLNAGNNSSRV